jgi:hypothetical protein
MRRRDDILWLLERLPETKYDQQFHTLYSKGGGKTFPVAMGSSGSRGGKSVNGTPVSYREAKDFAPDASLTTLDSCM